LPRKLKLAEILKLIEITEATYKKSLQKLRINKRDEGDPGMTKKLNLDDLIAAKQYEKETAEGSGDLENQELYDLIIPPGTVVSIIYDMVEEFGLEPVTRKMFVGIVNSEEREVLVLRGSLEKVQAAEKFLLEEMHAWLESP
jgi:hypothetical protein